jgi:hypothetical protein
VPIYESADPKPGPGTRIVPGPARDRTEAERMWRTDRQTWPCEGCGVIMARTYTPVNGVRGNAPTD